MGYHFLVLTAAQVEERRSALDRNGFYAYLSPIALLALLYLYRTSTTSTKSAIRLSEKPLNAPPSLWEAQKRRISWLLDQPLTPEFGAVKVHLFGALYAAWLLFLTFRETGDDYLHLTKRFGHVALSQLPFQYMLAIKSGRSPAQFATGLSHETLNPYHRLFGRIIHLFVIAHAVLYMNFFVAQGILQTRIGGWDVRLGLAAFWVFNALAITAIPPIRKTAYHYRFYKPHAILSGLLLPLFFFHVPYTRKYVIQMFVCYMFNGVARKNSTSIPILSSIVPIPGTALLKIRLPGPAWGVPPLMGPGTPGWVPGQHVYIKRAISPTEPRSPFTIISLPPREGQDGGHESTNIDLVVRNLKGPSTGWLAAKPKETGRLDRNATLLVEGPYGESKEYVPELLEAGEAAGSILLVAGGIGATYAVPIYLALLSQRESTHNVKFVWLVKSMSEASWGCEVMRMAKSADVDVTIYLTQKSDEAVNEKDNIGELKAGVKILEQGKRPEIQRIVDEILTPDAVSEKLPIGRSKTYSRVNVLVCGPPGMMKDTRAAVGRHVMGYGREVLYHEEAFGMGV